MIIDYLLRPDVIGIYIGIVGIILAYIFYVRSKEQIKPLIYIERTALIGKAQDLFPGSVEIRYNGKVVPVLSKARIVFWNGGRRTMEEDDIVRSDPIVVKFADPETRILDVRSVTTTRDVTNAKAILEDNCIRLSFDFLDQNDGLAFEAFYDCDSETKMILGGTVKGIRSGIALQTRSVRQSAKRAGALVLASILGADFTVAPFILLTVDAYKKKHDWGDYRTASIMFVIGISLLSFVLHAIFRNRIPGQLR